MNDSTDKAPQLSQTVGSTITRLQSDFLGSAPKHAAARATLAKLRRAAGTRPEDDPVAWSTALSLLGEQFLSTTHTDAQTTPNEEAAFTALTMYAIHQQSQKTKMHLHESGGISRNSFGFAAGTLARDRDSGSIKKRFDAVVTTKHAPSRQRQIRGLIELFSASGIPLDYGAFATHMRSSRFPSSWKRTVLIWVRDFARAFHSHPAEAATTATQSV